MKNYIQIISFLLAKLVFVSSVFAQTKLTLGKQVFELHNVTGSIIKFQGEPVLKIERDLNTLPFDPNRLEATVDEKHYAKLVGLNDFENGTIEIKMYSQIQDPSPFAGAAGFIELLKTILRLSQFICDLKLEEPQIKCLETTLFNIFLIRMQNLKHLEKIILLDRMRARHQLL